MDQLIKAIHTMYISYLHWRSYLKNFSEVCVLLFLENMASDTTKNTLLCKTRFLIRSTQKKIGKFSELQGSIQVLHIL